MQRSCIGAKALKEQVGASEGPSKQTDRSLIVGLAAVTIALSLLLKMVTAGWGVVIFAIPYLGICAIHFFAHSSTARGLLKRRWPGVAIAAMSDALLLGAFLLQLDAGDGPEWLTITALMGGGPGYPLAEPPSWWPSSLSLAVFVPLLASWILMVMVARRGESRAIRTSALAISAGLGCIVAGLLIAVVTSHSHALPAY